MMQADYDGVSLADLMKFPSISVGLVGIDLSIACPCIDGGLLDSFSGWGVDNGGDSITVSGATEEVEAGETEKEKEK